MRPEWIYGDHPPACTCWRCVAFRASRRTADSSSRKLIPRTKPGCFWMLGIAIAVCIAVLATILVMQSGFFDKQLLPQNMSQVLPTFTSLKDDIERKVVGQSATPSPPVDSTMPKLVNIEPKVRPTPTLTLSEIFRLNCIGELSDEETAQILEKRKLGNSSTSSVTSASSKTEITPTTEPTQLREPTPVPSLNSAVGYRSYMLDLINQDRKSHGLEEVVLGDNVAAQMHAEELFKHEFSGHWGLDGLKPYMRYTFAGGTGVEGENVSGSAQRIFGVRYATTPIEESLRDMQEGLMQSPGHRENILNPRHEKVNLGIACDKIGCSVVQQFESNFIEFALRPTIENGFLRFTGSTRKGIEYYTADVYYDPLPVPLTASQIRTAYCYDRGTLILSIREPASPSSYYSTDISERWWPDCRDPRDTDGSEKSITTALPNRLGLVPWEDASTYVTTGNQFDIAVDISDYISQYGDGVYTLLVWGESNAGSTRLTNYSIFIDSP